MPGRTPKKAELFGDIHAYGGAVILSVGAGLAWLPAGLMVLGLFLVFLGLFWRGR